MGNILKILHRVNDCGINGSVLGSNALDREFEYDPLNRLLSATGRESNTQIQNDYLYSETPVPGTPNANNVRAYSRSYAYDPLGNNLNLSQTATGNSFTRKFTYYEDVNTLEKIETGNDALIQGFTYDVAGNQLTAGDNRHYVRNAANQLISYYNQAGSANPTVYAQYDYDSSGNRVSKVVRTGTDISPVFERTIYIEGIFEYHIRENGTTVEKNSVHVIDDKSRIAMVRIGNAFPDDIADEITYVLENQIGSSISRLNTNGTEIDKEEFFPFGDTSLRTFSKKRYRYTGKEKDAESGLYYYGARYYAAWTCRFISVDALSKEYKQLTPYQNSGNNPINDRDIDGNQSKSTPKDKSTSSTSNNSSDKSKQSSSANGTIHNTGMPVNENIYEAPVRSDGEYEGEFKSHYDFASPGLVETAFDKANSDRGYINKGTEQEMKIYWNPSAKSNTKGHYFYQKPIKHSSEPASVQESGIENTTIPTPMKSVAYEPIIESNHPQESPKMEIPVNQIIDQFESLLHTDGTIMVDDLGANAQLDNLIQQLNLTQSPHILRINVQLGTSMTASEYRASQRGFANLVNYFQQGGLNANVAIQAGLVNPARGSSRVSPTSAVSFFIAPN